MENRHLFLFGGSPPFTEKLGKKFAQLTLGGKVAILFLERDGWEQYMPKYTSVLENFCLDDFAYLALRPKPDDNTLEILSSCAGIIIGGGETERYRDYIVDTTVGERIKERYEEGVPVAGFSAGALIAPENCVIPPIDNSENKHLFLRGLGLIKDCVISVHYTKWQEEANLRNALLKVETPVGYGMDDGAGIYFMNERVAETDGGNVYTFKK